MRPAGPNTAHVRQHGPTLVEQTFDDNPRNQVDGRVVRPCMRPRHLIATALTVVTALVVLAGPAAALDCAVHPDSSPRSIASGTEEMAGGDGFFDLFDRALVGTVVDTTAVGTEPDDRSLEHVLEVELVLGEAASPSHVTVRSTDTGWGVAEWEIGEGLFVPLSGADLARTEFGLCTPVHDVSADEVDELRELALSSGVEVGQIDESVAIDPDPAPDRAEASMVLGVAAAGVVVVGAGLVVTRPGIRRRS